jgi:hypothetical protein
MTRVVDMFKDQARAAGHIDAVTEETVTHTCRTLPIRGFQDHASVAASCSILP